MNSELSKLVTAGRLSTADAEKLNRLEPGTACQHKSWGLGKIAEWDLLGDRLLIDFEGKPGHPMKLSFAADSLHPLPADGLLARRVNDLGSLKAMAADKPASLVELALKSSGGKLALDDLEKLLTPAVVSTAEYKRWWENAKKELKSMRHVVVPTRRADPLLLRAQDEKPADVMVKGFQTARDMKGKLAALAAIVNDLDLFEQPATELVPVITDAGATARKSWRLHLKETLHLVLATDQLREQVKAEVASELLPVHDILREARGQLTDVVDSLPVGLLGRFYAAFPKAFPEGAWVKDSLNHLTRTGGRAVDEIASLMDANDSLDVLAEFLKKSVRNRTLSTDLLIWMCKERKGLAESVFDIDLGNAIISALEDDHVTGGPKKTARLHAAFADDRSLLGEMVAESSDEDLRLLAKRILNTSVFDELTRRSLMGKIIKSRPEMEKMMEENAEAQRDTSLVVSWESLERKKKELDDITNVQIPQNKKDIQIAREYGDLRENFEYKSARQQQAVLLRMQSKIERELRNAQGTDFTGVGTEQVSIGNVVDLKDAATGTTQTYTILGAWDGDPDKHIISYLSETAKAVIGKRVGEEAELPTDTQDGTRKVIITGIRTWVA